MRFFLVTMSHPDGEGWGKHVRAHVDNLQRLVAEGSIKALGRLKGKPLQSGITSKADNRDRVDAMEAGDPFAKAGLIAELAIHEWEPFFGVFALGAEMTLALDPAPGAATWP